MMKHLVKRNVMIDGTALLSDEKLSPSLERLIVMEWLNRMDTRLVKFVQEKFSTELSAGSNVLITMVESLSQNIESYITILNASRAVGAVSFHNPSFTDSPNQEEEPLAYQGAYRYGPQGGFCERTSFHDRGGSFQQFEPWRNVSGSDNQASSCEYCYIQSKTRNVDYNHPIARCPEMAALHGSVDMLDDETGIFEEEHEFETFAQEFFMLSNCHEVAADSNDMEKMANSSEHQELPRMNIMNITGLASNDESIGTIPWKPMKNLPVKPMQPTSRPTRCDKSKLSLAQELVNRTQPTTPGNLLNDSNQTLATPTTDLSVQTEFNDEELVANSFQVAAAVALQAEVDQLKKDVAALVFVNNRYHLAISHCTFCTSDDDNSDASTSLDASIRASTPVCQSPRSGVPFVLPSPGSAPALLSRTIPALMSLIIDDRTKAEVDTMLKRKEKAFISSMVKNLTKLETKHLNPRHNRKGRSFTRKHKNIPIIPKELTSNYRVLAAPEPEELADPKPLPHVRWNDESIEPALPVTFGNTSLPNAKSCPVHSCFPDHELYVDKDSPSFHCNYDTESLAEKISSTDVAVPDDLIDQTHIQSVLTGTCDPKSIVQLPHLKDNHDEEFFSPLTPKNHPILFSFADQPHYKAIHHGAVEAAQADYHEVVQPSLKPPDDYAAGRRACRFQGVYYEALHEYEGRGRGLQGG